MLFPHHKDSTCHQLIDEKTSWSSFRLCFREYLGDSRPYFQFVGHWHPLLMVSIIICYLSGSVQAESISSSQFPSSIWMTRVCSPWFIRFRWGLSILSCLLSRQDLESWAHWFSKIHPDLALRKDPLFSYSHKRTTPPHSSPNFCLCSSIYYKFLKRQYSWEGHFESSLEMKFNPSKGHFCEWASNNWEVDKLEI